MAFKSELVTGQGKAEFFEVLTDISITAGLAAVGMQPGAVCWNEFGATINGQRETGLIIGIRLSAPELPAEVRDAIKNLQKAVEKADCDQRVRPH